MKLDAPHPYDEQTQALKASISEKLNKIGQSDLRSLASQYKEGVQVSSGEEKRCMSALIQSI
jgi:hypothetical protein